MRDNTVVPRRANGDLSYGKPFAELQQFAIGDQIARLRLAQEID